MDVAPSTQEDHTQKLTRVIDDTEVSRVNRKFGIISHDVLNANIGSITHARQNQVEKSLLYAGQIRLVIMCTVSSVSHSSATEGKSFKRYLTK